jgi:hypothetical protein
MGANPSIQVRFVDPFRRVTAPGILFRELTLLEVITEFGDRENPGARKKVMGIDLFD